jgi:hypothetical protein
MSKSGAYVAPNSRKKEPITSLNTESAKEFPGLKIGTEVTKKPAPISFAALLKKKEETKEPVEAPVINNSKYKMRVVDIPDKPDDEDDEYMKHMYVPDLSKLMAARALRKQKEEREKKQRLFESSSSEGELPEDDLSEEFMSGDEDDLQEHEDTYDPSEFDRHR